MPKTERRYDLHGVSVLVRSRSHGLLDTAHLFFEHFGLREDGLGDADLVFDLGGDCTPPAPRQGRWLEIPGCGLSVLDGGDEVEVRSRNAAIRFAPADGRAELMVDADLEGRGRLNINLLSFALLSLLRGHDLFPLHAACVEHNGRGMVIVADSGCGKTTLASRLMMSGWSYLSDDSVLLRPRRGGIQALALRRDLFVLPGSSELAECADPETWRDTNKLRVDVAKRFPDRLVDRCDVKVVILPKIVADAQSTICECSPEDALQLVTHQSLVADLDRSRARQHLEALARLVNTTKCYELQAGSDIVEDHDCAHRLLAPLCDQAS